MNNLHINTLVFNDSIPNLDKSPVVPNFFCRFWKIFPKYSWFEICISQNSAISKWVTRLVRHRDPDERDNDGAVHWDTMYPKLLKAFGHLGARKFSHEEWLQHIHGGSNKMRFEYCESSKGSFLKNSLHHVDRETSRKKEKMC